MLKARSACSAAIEGTGIYFDSLSRIYVDSLSRVSLELPSPLYLSTLSLYSISYLLPVKIWKVSDLTRFQMYMSYIYLDPHLVYMYVCACIRWVVYQVW